MGELFEGGGNCSRGELIEVRKMWLPNDTCIVLVSCVVTGDWWEDSFGEYLLVTNKPISFSLIHHSVTYWNTCSKHRTLHEFWSKRRKHRTIVSLSHLVNCNLANVFLPTTGVEVCFQMDLIILSLSAYRSPCLSSLAAHILPSTNQRPPSTLCPSGDIL